MRVTRVVSYRREMLEIGRTGRQKTEREGVNVVLLRQCDSNGKSMRKNEAHAAWKSDNGS